MNPRPKTGISCRPSHVTVHIETDRRKEREIERKRGGNMKSAKDKDGRSYGEERAETYILFQILDPVPIASDVPP